MVLGQAPQSEVCQEPNSTAEAAATTAEDESVLTPDGPTTRTRDLLLAALRVWELKQGIHDY